MNVVRTIAVLVSAALLESGGDAVIRRGLQGRSWLIACGALALLAYGILVNQAGLDFGRSIGIYIGAFFVVSQVISIAMFGDPLTWQTIVGGVLIVGGGAVLLL
jgi:drug/metabolite transporter superfamily protein YnfA